MAHLTLHPAPGFGDMLPGWFAVPQNPLTNGGAPTYTPSIGELMPGKFPVPQNPILNTVGLGDCGCGCRSWGSSCGCSGLSGLGQLGLLANPWVLGAGALLLFMLMAPGGSSYRRERREAKAAYRRKLGQLRRKHRGYRRVSRAAAERGQLMLEAAK